LLEFGAKSKDRLLIVPTGDIDVLTISKHRHQLEPYYLFSMPSFETVRKLVHKREFYQWLDGLRTPYPQTHFPEDLDELQAMAGEIKYPFIIKPVYSAEFQNKFGRKCFLIDSSKTLKQALNRLHGKDSEVMIQEMVPGEDLYSLYTCFNRESKPIAICGYDKLRQYPPLFGSGSLCKISWRAEPINQAVRVLQALGYHGIAEVEFIRDPRDGRYKMLEINARTTRQNRLPAEFGVDVEYIAYLDAIGQAAEFQANRENEVFWVDDYYDVLSRLSGIGKKKIRSVELSVNHHHEKVHSIFARDDPAPAVIEAFNLSAAAFRLLFKKLKRER
jgi:predicted ATP-grasp superfamily ATP-dependent carboligase